MQIFNVNLMLYNFINIKIKKKAVQKILNSLFFIFIAERIIIFCIFITIYQIDTLRKVVLKEYRQGQVVLFPESLESYIPEDAPVKLVNQIVDQLTTCKSPQKINL